MEPGKFEGYRVREKRRESEGVEMGGKEECGVYKI